MNRTTNILSRLFKKGASLPFATLFSLSLAVACTGVSPTALNDLTGVSAPGSNVPAAGTPNTIVILGGNGQSGMTNSILANPLTVLVTDINGLPVPNAPVTFNITSGGGNFIPAMLAPVNTNQGGMAVVAFQLGSWNGTQTLTASIASGTTTNVQFTEIASSSTTNPPGVPKTLMIFGGNGQSGTVSTTLSNPLTVKVVDNVGTPVPNVMVTFASATGGGSISSTAVIATDASGLASAIGVLGSSVGAQTYTATMPTGTTTTATFSETGSAVPSRMIIAASPNGITPLNPTSLQIGNTLALRSILVDNSGNFLQEVTATWWTSGALNPGNLSANPDSNPAHFIFTPTVAGSGSIEAQVTNGTTITTNNIISASALVGILSVTSNLATNVLSISSGNNQNGVVNAALSNPIVAKVKDSNGNPVSGIPVTFAVATGGGSISSTVTVNTDSTGSASANVTLGAAVGAQTFSATMAQGSPATVTYSANAAASVGAPSVISIAAGSNQSGVVNTALGNPITALVVDANGLPVSGVPVTFAVASGGGSISTSTTVSTNSNGNASASVVLGNSVGAQTYTATMPSGLTKTATFNMTGTAIPSYLKIALDTTSSTTTAIGTTSIVSGTTMTIHTVLVDGSGTFITEINSNWWTTGSLNGGDLTVTGGAPNKIAVYAPSSGGNGTIQASVTNGALISTYNIVSATAITGVITATANPATNILSIATGNNQGAIKNTALSNPLVAKVVDVNGNPVSGIAVTFAVATGGGSITSTATVNTDSTGTASANATLGATVGAQTFTATMAQGTTKTATFSATAANAVGAPNVISIVSGNNQTGIVSTQLSSALSVNVVDSNSIPVPGATVTFAVTGGGGSIVTSTTPATDSNGNASATVNLGSTVGAQTFTAHISTGATQTVTFNMTATAVPSYLVISSSNSANTPITAQSIVANGTNHLQMYTVLVDANGNFLKTIAANWYTSGSLNSPDLVVAGGNPGLGGNFIPSLPGNGTVQATVTSSAVISSNNIVSSTAITGIITATNNPLTNVISIFAGNNQGATVSTQLSNPLTVTVVDLNGNPVAGVPVTFAVASGGGSVNPATAVNTNSSGNASVTATLGGTVGAQTFTATMAQGTTKTVTFSETGSVSIGAPASISILSGNNQGGTVSTVMPNPLLVIVRDASGNAVPGASVTFAAASGGGSVNPATAVSTNSIGQASAIGTLGATIGAQTFTATVGAFSTTFNMNAVGTPNTIAILSGNNQSAFESAQPSNPLSVKVTDASNNPIPNVQVTFSTLVAGASIVTGQPVTTDNTGVASSTITLGTVLGNQTFTATMPTGATKTVNFSETATITPTYLKIIKVGQTSALTGATGLSIGNTLALQAVLMDAGGTIKNSSIAANWTLNGLNGANLAISGGNPSNLATYTANQVENGYVNVSISDSTLITNNNIVSTSFVSGQVNSALALVPYTVSKVSGDTQTGTVGSSLASQLKVLVVNAGGFAVPGANVTFAVASGGGVIVTAQPSVTDSNGFAYCTVNLGGLAGSNTNSFTATITGGGQTQALFTASSTFGAPHHLGFITQPGGANAGGPLGTQPGIGIYDSYGNLVTTATNVVTASLAAGAGSLTGTLTATAVNGIATFSNLTYSVAGTGIQIAVAASGLTGATSNAFVSNAIIAAAQCACSTGGVGGCTGFSTTDGGCKDLTSGIVWSSDNGGAMSGNAAVWDSTVSGAVAPKAWETALGITKDGTYDASAGDYCHSLTESGFNDWRMPTEGEWAGTDIHGGSTQLKNPPAAYYLTGQSEQAGYNYVYTTFNGAGTDFSWAILTTAYRVRCVRQPPPTQLLFTTQPGGGANGLGVNVPFAVQPVVKLADSTNSFYTGHPYATVPMYVTVSLGSGTGVLSGTLTQTVVNGVATFANLSYNKAETISLVATLTNSSGTANTSPSFVATGTSSSITINQNYPLALCKTVGGVWINATGGCKDTTTGLIWSSASTSAMSWNDAVWDQSNPAGNAGTQKTSDNGRTNDYDAAYPPGAGTDTSSVNYCHNLAESGLSDWIMPTVANSYYNTDSAGHSPPTYLNLPLNQYFWTSGSSAATTAYAGGPLSGGYWTAQNKATWNTSAKVFCQRRDPPTQLTFSTQPGGGAMGFGNGVVWNVQPVVNVLDAQGAGPLYYDSATVTLTVQAASDTTGGTGTFQLFNAQGLLPITSGTVGGVTIFNGGKSVSVVAVNGKATFSNIAYWGPAAGEKFSILATATADTWGGNSYNLTSATSTDITMPKINTPSSCLAVGNNWSTSYGGCYDGNAGGLVWGPLLADAGGTIYSWSWYQAIWDSTYAGSSPVRTTDQYRQTNYSSQCQAASGGYCLNDYDSNAAFPVSTGIDSNTMDACHSLYLNGYSDWRMPSQTEVNAAMAAGSHDGYPYVRGIAAWTMSSSTEAGTPANVWGYYTNGATFATNWLAKGSSYYVRCVRNHLGTDP